MMMMVECQPLNKYSTIFFKLQYILGHISDGDHSAVELDVSDSSAVNNLLQTVLKQYKQPPSIVVNSAGITRDNWLLKLSESDYESVLSVNLKVSKKIM